MSQDSCDLTRRRRWLPPPHCHTPGGVRRDPVYRRRIEGYRRRKLGWGGRASDLPIYQGLFYIRTTTLEMFEVAHRPIPSTSVDHETGNLLHKEVSVCMATPGLQTLAPFVYSKMEQVSSGVYVSGAFNIKAQDGARLVVVRFRIGPVSVYHVRVLRGTGR